MRAGNPLEQMSAAMYSAIFKDLPDVEYEYRSTRQVLDKEAGTPKKRRPYADEVEVVMFPQMWGSTALGFGGMGGAAMTKAYTTVVFGNSNQSVCVYFGTRLAYAIDKDIPSEFWADLKNHNMPSVDKAIKRYSKIEE